MENTTNQEVLKNFDDEILKTLKVDVNSEVPVLHQVLRIAVYDEYHAYETYKKVLETFGDTAPFTNIIEAEVRHYQALSHLLEKYQVPAPLNDWEGTIEAPNSILEACEVAVAAEIDNIKMYDSLISYVQEYPDVLDTMYRLQAASYNNHLPAFRQAVAQHSQSSNVNLNDIHQQYSAHNLDDAIGKMDEIGQMVQKFSAGDVSQEDLMKMLSNTNISFIGGALLGAVGAGMLSQMIKENEHKSTQEED